MKDYSAGDERRRTAVDVLGLILAAVTLSVSVTWAADPVKASALQAYPDAYKMKVVQVEGTVRNYRMNHFIGERTKLEKCIQVFSVDDGTGTVDASYSTICTLGTVMLQEGDQVTVEGHFLGTLDVKSVKKN